MHWHWIALAYVSYLALVALGRPAPARARRATTAAALLAWGAMLVCAGWAPPSKAVHTVVEVVVPAVVLLVGYWLSGTFFVRPMPTAERFLLDLDDRLVGGRVLDWYRSAPRVVKEYFELSYLLVYALIPTAAVTLAVGGLAGQLDGFWTMVLAAEFICYGTLPWLQTRPPRTIEARSDKEETPIFMRRLNRAVLDHGSIGVNTVPSGHAAGAVAAALFVCALMPMAGFLYILLAVSIAAAAVVGRYHYALDSLLGVAVAIAVWMVT